MSKSSSSQLESDFVKVGKEMKEMLDVLLDIGVQSPTVAGILVEGYTIATPHKVRKINLKNFEVNKTQSNRE